jgi:hypothetical protein
MKGRRTAAMLCVLLGHALVVLMLSHALRPKAARQTSDVFVTRLIELPFVVDQKPYPEPRAALQLDPPQLPPDALGGTDAAVAGTGESADATERGYVDWPKEGRDAAARVLAREAESGRVAKMFAGPQGTWASLTKRQQSELNHFRWKPGIDGLERDERGNTIFTMTNGCALVNFQLISCPIGKKPPAYGDLFKDMRLYFDEQRRPATQEGNGREPESMRPPKWSKPLPDPDR